MDILPSGSFFKELQIIHETGYFPEHFSVEDKWEQAENDDNHHHLRRRPRRSFHSGRHRLNLMMLREGILHSSEL
ncbi:hypothetical protein TYRP_001995 [Tyrophagus putrescentiae]|nr:hypothetical protein TYRP_001995 [Tyrophagus putrescentiae]